MKKQHYILIGVGLLGLYLWKRNKDKKAAAEKTVMQTRPMVMAEAVSEEEGMEEGAEMAEAAGVYSSKRVKKYDI